ncbi:MAG: rhomboid family intramembrane serine protease [Armatimonadetes bacterium]|nr:MAG: rhomboid family intramembrane serine protease [Armatimonadota bacterium]
MIPLQDKSSSIFPFWVVLLIAINVYVFYLELTAVSPEVLITRFALIPAQISLLQPLSLLTFVTNQFLHGGFIHIISNMWFLWIFGDNVEEGLGFILFPVIYFLAGISGNLLQYFLSPTSQIPIIGASGAIAGILGSYYALYPSNRVKTLVFIIIFITIIEIPASFMLFYWFILQLFSSAVSIADTTASTTGGVAYFAHIGGFVLGWIISKLVKRRSRQLPA